MAADTSPYILIRDGNQSNDHIARFSLNLLSKVQHTTNMLKVQGLTTSHFSNIAFIMFFHESCVSEYKWAKNYEFPKKGLLYNFEILLAENGQLLAS